MLPAQLPNFETQARRLRYQALGVACRDSQIRSLLLAHHDDDQAETILMRLAQGHREMGLLGMQSVAQIPECWGIHGVHQSGIKELNVSINASRSSREGRPPGLFHKVNTSILFEDGGINICRPLLEFSKDRLRATCHASQVKWVEDKTNRDPTRTPRNAVRHLLCSDNLPLSLQKPSLLALRTRTMEKAKDRASRAKSFFNRCEITMLDTRSGGLVVRMQDHAMSTKFTPPDYRQQKLIEAEYKAALMLRQLLEIVTPQESISLKSLEFAVKSIFPELKDRTVTHLDRNREIPIFTAGGVSFQRVRSPSQPPTGDKNQPRPKRPRTQECSLNLDFVWVLTRQPYSSTGEIPTIRISPTLSDPLPGSRLSKMPCSPLEQPFFHLWDHRWWFCVHPAPFPILIRPLRPEDLSRLRTSCRTQEVKELDEILRIVAPGKIRWTLPVILQVLETGEEEVLAVPTLPWGRKAREMGVIWEVRYKKVDLGPFRDLRRIAIRYPV